MDFDDGRRRRFPVAEEFDQAEMKDGVVEELVGTECQPSGTARR